MKRSIKRLKLFLVGSALTISLLFGAILVINPVLVYPSGMQEISLWHLTWTDTRIYTSINAAVAAIGASNKNLLIVTPQTLTASLTIPANVNTIIWRNGSIVKAGAFTLTINGPFEVGLYQVFSGFCAGDGTCGNNISKEVYRVWWGENTTPGTTDMTTKIQSGISSLTKGDVVINHSIYLISSGLSFSGKSNVRLKGFGVGSQILASAATFHMITISAASTDIEICDLYIKGASTGVEGFVAIGVSSGTRIKVRRNKISDINSGVSIYDEDSNECEIEENNFVDIKGGTSGNGYGVFTISQRNRIVNNLFSGVGRHDVYLAGSTGSKGAINNTVIGNISINNGLEAIALYALPTQLALTGNIIKGNVIINPVNGIGLDQNCVSNVISGNSIIGATNISIWGNGDVAANTYPNFNVISGTSIYNSPSTSGVIRIVNGSYNIISLNQINNPGTSGIFLTSVGTPDVWPTSNQITDNLVNGAAGNSIFVDTTCLNTNIRDNTFPTTFYNIGGTLMQNGGLSAAIASGATIAHRLSDIPTIVNVNATDVGATNIYISVDATNITVTFVGAGNHTFYWYAAIRP